MDEHSTHTQDSGMRNIPTLIPIPVPRHSTGLRPGTTIPSMITPIQPNENQSIQSSSTTSSTRRARQNRHNPLAHYLVQDPHPSTHTRSSTSSSRLPGMMIYEFPFEDFEAYVHWLSEHFGNKKMFLSLDYPTLHLWMKDHFHVSSFHEVHQLPFMPPKVLFSTFGYAHANTHQSDY